MKNTALKKPRTKFNGSGINLVEDPHIQNMPPEPLEDIWGKDLWKYQKEVFQMGTMIMLFSGFLMFLVSSLSLFGWSIPTVQGSVFFIFVAGFALVLKAFSVKLLD